MKIIYIFFISAFLLLTYSAQSQNTSDLMHLQYGSNKQNTLDLFLPKSCTPKTPVIIMLHGGAWMMGGNEYTDKTAKDLRDRGFVVANVDYRYVNDSVYYKDLMQDIDNAITYMQRISKEHNFSNNAYHLAGISAGAHLALLYSYTAARKVKSISALCAPSRFDDAETLLHLQDLQLVKNVEFLADAQYTSTSRFDPNFTLISPYALIKSVPTLLIHGDKDEMVLYSQSSALYELLQKENVKSKLVTMKGKGHDVGMNQANSEKIVLDEITNWVKQYN